MNDPARTLARLAVHLAAHPADGAAWVEAAESWANLGNWGEAHRALDQAGPIPAALATRAQIYQREGRSDLAIQVLGGRDDPSLGVERGWLLVRLGRLDEAEADFRRAWAVRPGLASALAGVATCQERRGAGAEALRLVEPWIGEEPPPVLAWAWSRAALASGAAERVVARLPSWLERPMRPSDRADLYFALGDAHDAVGRPDLAIAAWERANEGGRPFDGARHLDAIRTLTRHFPQAGLAPSPGISGRALLVVGVPRSGTTLVETMLARHPAIAPAGELEWWRLLAVEAGERAGVQPWYRAPHHLRTEDLSDLASRYLDALDEVNATALRVVDKMPNNFLHLGLVGWCLPDTVVVHCIRDPADTALSCFRVAFGDGLPWARTWAGIAAWIQGERLLMEHWRATLGIRIIEVRYERLVADPESELRPVLEACGLPWDGSVAAHAGTDRRVATASYAQVRRPLHREGVGRASRYHPWMEPFFQAMEAKTSAP